MQSRWQLAAAASSGTRQQRSSGILRRESGHAKAAALEDGAAAAHRSSSLSLLRKCKAALASFRPAAACAVSSARVGDSVCLTRVRSGPRAHLMMR